MKPGNKFNVQVEVGLNQDQQIQLLRYINLKHTGKTDVPFDYIFTKEHKDAVYTALMGRRISLSLEFNPDGEIVDIKIKKDTIR